MKIVRNNKGILQVVDDRDPHLARFLSWWLVLLVELPVNLIAVTLAGSAVLYYKIINKIKGY